MNNIKQRLSKMYKEQKTDYIESECDETHTVRYIPAVLYSYVKRRHFDTIKNGGYTNTVHMDISNETSFDFKASSDIMDDNPYASVISLGEKNFDLINTTYIHMQFQFVCRYKIMMRSSKTIRRMRICLYTKQISHDTGTITCFEFDGKDLDLIMKHAESINDIIEYATKYIISDSSDTKSWSKDNATVDDYYKVVKSDARD